MPDFWEVLYTRRSIREFKKGAPVEPWKIEKILDAARWAPSPENMQYWRMVLVRDQEMKEYIADMAQEHGATVFGNFPYEIVEDRLWYIPEKSRAAVIERAYDGTLFRYPEDADTVIVPCANTTAFDITPAYPSSTEVMVVSTSMAIQNMWLATRALNLGMGYDALPCGDHRRREKLADKLGLPRGVFPLTTLAVGVPLFPRTATPARYPLEGIVYEEYWGNPYKRLAFRKKG
ncbi:MAG: nitroreductase family protein [Candidatus Jordarchaeaceae archaeon]